MRTRGTLKRKAKGYWQASAQASAPVQAMAAWQQESLWNTQPARGQTQGQTQAQRVQVSGTYAQYGQPGGGTGGYSFGTESYDAISGAEAGASPVLASQDRHDAITGQ